MGWQTLIWIYSSELTPSGQKLAWGGGERQPPPEPALGAAGGGTQAVAARMGRCWTLVATCLWAIVAVGAQEYFGEEPGQKIRTPAPPKIFGAFLGSLGPLGAFLDRLFAICFQFPDASS